MVSTYHISNHSASSYESLVDIGANGGLAGSDVHALERKYLSKALMTVNNLV